MATTTRKSWISSATTTLGIRALKSSQTSSRFKRLRLRRLINKSKTRMSRRSIPLSQKIGSSEILRQSPFPFMIFTVCLSSVALAILPTRPSPLILDAVLANRVSSFPPNLLTLPPRLPSSLDLVVRQTRNATRRRTNQLLHQVLRRLPV